ncbi:SgcJ/EcaC family oxidoreductase [Arthrobacter sp. Sa2BUA2]|uniref:SgcJ/EcaC family oxidoreductase n=1 Tax=Arthrobacter pullicola TaxID=2762224 RepID=A0ABR8YGA4_9MICC|nr:SgcJ/EcaC family oxidoreductase [Arthrobacter pullicola]MBD8043247.1 SgcJ/EcaC family oxidoreductase [Arthrobacter pullicola]
MNLTRDEVQAAAQRLVAAFAATDTEAYFGAFAEDATFVFHTEPARLESRSEYRSLWEGWTAEGWAIESCTSTNARIQLAGPSAVFTHDVHTVAGTPGASEETRERETIVFVRTEDGAVLAVHEHLSPAPAASEDVAA